MTAETRSAPDSSTANASAVAPLACSRWSPPPNLCDLHRAIVIERVMREVKGFLGFASSLRCLVSERSRTRANRVLEVRTMRRALLSSAVAVIATPLALAGAAFAQPISEPASCAGYLVSYANPNNGWIIQEPDSANRR